MDQLGYRTNDYMVTGNITGSVYRKDTNGKTVYTAEVWNPTDKTQTVAIKDKLMENRLVKLTLVQRHL